MGQDCHWDREEQYKEWTAQLICFLPSQRQFCPILNQGADQQCSLSSVLLLSIPEAVLTHTKAWSRSAVQSINFKLLAVPYAVSSHTKARSRSANQFQLFTAPRCPRGSLVPYKSEENQFHAVLALLGTGAPTT